MSASDPHSCPADGLAAPHPERAGAAAPHATTSGLGTASAGALHETATAWARLGFYERFEQIVSLALTAVISAVILLALLHLVVDVVDLLSHAITNPVGHATFQAVFGMILTVLIALEFNHTIIGILQRRGSVVQLRTVIVIALLAVARKFVIIDATSTDPLTLIGLSAAVLALGTVYWLVRAQELGGREPATKSSSDPDLKDSDASKRPHPFSK